MNGADKLIAAMREAHEAHKAACHNVSSMKARHALELEEAHRAEIACSDRVDLLDETLRLMVSEGMPLEQAKMVAHDTPRDERGQYHVGERGLLVNTLCGGVPTVLRKALSR